MTLIERCGYAVLNIKDEFCVGCDGYAKSCFKYTTRDHLKEFYKHFKDGNKPESIGRLEDLEDGGGFDNSHRYG